MNIKDLIQAQLVVARQNQADSAFNEDYVEAAVWTHRTEALEDLMAEVDHAEHNHLHLVADNG